MALLLGCHNMASRQYLTEIALMIEPMLRANLCSILRANTTRLIKREMPSERGPLEQSIATCCLVQFASPRSGVLRNVSYRDTLAW
jgi:hypothetical protein